jgi:glutamyl-tRNA reductase
MRILVIGLNHKTAPVEVREKLAFDAAGAARATAELRALRPDCEAVILSTCNRVELYVAGPVPARGGPTAEDLTAFLAAFHGLPAEKLAGCLYRHEHEAAVRHLFRVASGLDSMVLGEYQIVNQVKEAWMAAGSAGGTGRLLNKLFTAAFESSKEIRTRTTIGQGKVSVSSVAVDLVKEIFTEFSDKTVLLVGAGKMSELTLRHLVGLGVSKVIVCNRTAERAAKLAEKYGATAAPFEELHSLLARADIVLSGTGAREPVIRAAAFGEIVRRRNFRTMFLIDIAVPRDIEPEVAEYSNVYLYNVDDLQRIVARNVDARTRQLAACQEIVERGVAGFLSWFDARDAGPVIGLLQKKLKEIAAGELERLRPKLTGDPSADWGLIEQAFERTLNKVLHGPIENLKSLARGPSSSPPAPAPAPDGKPDPSAPGGQMVSLVRRLFDLGEG